MSAQPPSSSPQSSTQPSRWSALLDRLRVAREELEIAAARSGQVPARLLRRLALLKLAIPLTLLLGGGMLWVTERGYQRLEEVYADLKLSRVLSSNLNTLSFLASRVGATQAEYLLERTPEALSRHRSIQQQISALRDVLAEGARSSEMRADVETALRYVDGEREELQRLSALPTDAPSNVVEAQLKPNPVSDGALREALGRMVGHERSRLDGAETAALQEIRRQRWFTLGSIGVGLLLLLLLLRAYRGEFKEEQRMAGRLQDERDRLERAVRERTRELSELATHLQHLAEREKARLARELHDELGAILTASKMDVSMMLRRGLEPRQSAIESLQRLQENLERGIQLKRRVIEGLVPSTLTNLGLTAAIDSLADEVEAPGGVKVERRWPDDLNLDGERSTAIYRIVQEALTNVQKHSRASRVLVELALEDDTLHLRVRDNGVGWDAVRAGKLKSHGLRGMKHRVDAFGGRFAIGRADGGGTELSVELPLTDLPVGEDSD